MNGIEGEGRAQRAEVLAHLSNACRQIGAMMEAGVDILAITRVLRAQSEDEDILRLCDRIDFDLKQGRALADAMNDERDLFSPFMVTLVRQGEERNTLPQAFTRVSSALDAERQELLQLLPPTTSGPAQATAQAGERGEREPPQVLEAAQSTSDGDMGARFEVRPLASAQGQTERAEARWLRAASSLGAGLLVASAVSEALVALGLPAKWQRPLSKTLSAAVLALAALEARKMEEVLGKGAPQVLAYVPQAVESPQARPEARAEAEGQLAEAEPPRLENSASTSEAPVREEALGPNAVYSGAPREDEEELPRQVRRPRHEEEFD